MTAGSALRCQGSGCEHYFFSMQFDPVGLRRKARQQGWFTATDLMPYDFHPQCVPPDMEQSRTLAELECGLCQGSEVADWLGHTSTGHRITNQLHHAGFRTMAALAEQLAKNPEVIHDVRTVGVASFVSIKGAVEAWRMHNVPNKEEQ